MPIRRGFSREVVSDNIRMLRAEGYPQQQAIAIALETARKYAKPKKPAKRAGKRR